MNNKYWMDRTQILCSLTLPHFYSSTPSCLPAPPHPHLCSPAHSCPPALLHVLLQFLSSCPLYACPFVPSSCPLSTGVFLSSLVFSCPPPCPSAPLCTSAPPMCPLALSSCPPALPRVGVPSIMSPSPYSCSPAPPSFLLPPCCPLPPPLVSCSLLSIVSSSCPSCPPFLSSVFYSLLHPPSCPLFSVPSCTPLPVLCFLPPSAPPFLSSVFCLN